MVEVHGYTAEAVLGLSIIAGAWGAVAWILKKPSVYFWYVLRAAQVVLVLQVILGVILLLSGHKPKEELHFVYGIAPLFVMMIAEGLRVSSAAKIVGEQDIHQLDRAEQQEVAMAIVRRETGIMAVAALLVAALAIRAMMSAGYFS